MMTLQFIIIIFLPLLLGLFFIELCCGENRWNAFFRIGMGYGLGLGFIAQWIFFIGSMGFPINALMINGPLLLIVMMLAVSLFRTGRLGTCLPHVVSTPSLGLWDWVLLIGVGFFGVVVLMWALVLVPVSSWDAVATVAFKGKFFFYEQTFLFNKSLPHPSYPLHVPLLMTWTALSIGQWHEYFVKGVFPLYFLSLIFIVYGFLREFIDRRLALLGVVLLCFSNYFILHASIAYRDFSLTFYNCLAVFLIILWHRSGSRKILLLAGLVSGMATFVKLEGIGYVVVHALFVLWLGRPLGGTRVKAVWSAGKNVVDFLFPVIVFLSAYAVFKLFYGVPFGEETKTEIVFSIDLFLRIPVIIGSFLKNLFGTRYWGWNWYLLAVCVLLCHRGMSLMERHLVFVLVLFFSACGALFLMTPNYQYLNTPGLEMLLPRLFLHFFPLCPILIVMIFYRIFPDWRVNKN